MGLSCIIQLGRRAIAAKFWQRKVRTPPYIILIYGQRVAGNARRGKP